MGMLVLFWYCYDDFLAAMADLSPTAPEDEITSLLSSHGVHLQPSSTQ